MDKKQESNLTKRHLRAKLKYEIGIIWAAKWLRQQLDSPYDWGSYSTDAYMATTTAAPYYFQVSSSSGSWSTSVGTYYVGPITSAGASYPNIPAYGGSKKKNSEQYLSDDMAGISVGPVAELMKRARDG